MHHPEQYRAMAKDIHNDRLREGLTLQEVSRNRPKSDKLESFSGRYVSLLLSAVASIKLFLIRLN